jgi:Holliday junction resolvase RusA-like endonuclease
LQSFVISWPPSTNSLWRAYRGRNILSRPARLWAIKAEKELLDQGARPTRGPVEVDIELCAPTRRAFDPDNRTKAVLDLLVKSYVIEDDNNSIVKRISVSIGEGFVGARVTIRPV